MRYIFLGLFFLTYFGGSGQSLVNQVDSLLEMNLKYEKKKEVYLFTITLKRQFKYPKLIWVNNLNVEKTQSGYDTIFTITNASAPKHWEDDFELATFFKKSYTFSFTMPANNLPSRIRIHLFFSKVNNETRLPKQRFAGKLFYRLPMDSLTENNTHKINAEVIMHN